MGNINLTGIVLAGGKGSRIGCNKSFLKIGDCYLIERVIDRLSQLTSTVLVVTNKDQYDLMKNYRLRADVLADLYPDRGPLGGIYTGLLSSQNTYCLTVACDMPFINSDLMNYLTDKAAGHDAVVPKIGGRIEPLHAIYSKNCLPKIDCVLQAGILHISHLFSLINTGYVTEYEINMFDPDHLSFFNINTESDLMKAKLLIGHTDTIGQEGKFNNL